MIKVHEIKILPTYLSEIIKGNKTFELRKDDKNFNVGDMVVLREFNYDDLEYTGLEVKVLITYILRNVNTLIDEKMCVFSFIKV